MNYTALYRKFRPKTFDEMVGQEHITRTLKNQIKANRIGHAYLFNGGRGTGKTSAAKIMARAINCLNPKDVSDNWIKGTWIRKGDKIGQFRIMEVMPEIEFEEVEE